MQRAYPLCPDICARFEWPLDLLPWFPEAWVTLRASQVSSRYKTRGVASQAKHNASCAPEARLSLTYEFLRSGFGENPRVNPSPDARSFSQCRVRWYLPTTFFTKPQRSIEFSFHPLPQDPGLYRCSGRGRILGLYNVGGAPVGLLEM